MSVESMAIVLHHSRATGTAKLVLVGIANHEGDGGAFPSVATLAKYANVQPRNVQVALRKLEQLGELHTARQAGGMADVPDVERPNLYRVTVTCPADCDGTSRHRRRSHQRRLPGWSTPVDNPVTIPSGGDASVTGGGDASVTGGGDASVTLTTHVTTPRTKDRGASSALADDSSACCVDGWRGEDDDGRPIPCPIHRSTAARRVERHRQDDSA